MKNKTAIIVASVSLLGLGAYFYFKRRNEQNETSETTQLDKMGQPQIKSPSILDIKKEELFWKAYQAPKVKVGQSQLLFKAAQNNRELLLLNIEKNGWIKEYEAWVRQRELEKKEVRNKALLKELGLLAMKN